MVDVIWNNNASFMYMYNRDCRLCQFHKQKLVMGNLHVTSSGLVDWQIYKLWGWFGHLGAYIIN